MTETAHATTAATQTQFCLGLQPFEACPSPSPHAPTGEYNVRTARRTKHPPMLEQDRGWVSPCCFMPRQSAS